MITFDGEYSVVIHVEVNENQALEHGGINIELAKKNCTQLSDWILEAISDTISLEDTDSITVIPIEQKLMIDEKQIDLDKTSEDYDVTIEDSVTVNFNNKEIKEGKKDVENEI